MTRDLEPVTEDSEVCKALPVVRDKCFVDFFAQTHVNQLDVVRAHNDTKRERQGLFARFVEGVTGKSARRDKPMRGIKPWNASGGSMPNSVVVAVVHAALGCFAQLGVQRAFRH